MVSLFACLPGGEGVSAVAAPVAVALVVAGYGRLEHKNRPPSVQKLAELRKPAIPSPDPPSAWVLDKLGSFRPEIDVFGPGAGRF